MQKNILWTGREYYSLENCLISSTEKGIEINSVIIGKYNNKIYKVAYQIKTNSNWETIFFEFKSQHSNKQEHQILQSDARGNWYSNNLSINEFKDCLDIDIPLTPFTNTLPINRLKLNQNESHQIKVIYFDLLEGEIKPVQQKYTRLSNTQYHYENIPTILKLRFK